MSANRDALLSQLANATNRANAQRAASVPRAPSATLAWGMVVGQDGPIHVVDVLGDAGQAVARIPGVVCLGGPPRGVGATVLLAYNGRSPVPVIVGGGGGRSGVISGEPIDVISAQVFG